MGRSSLVLAVFAVVACGGSHDTAAPPPPPPVNRVAALRASDSSVLQLTARKAPIAALFHAVDVNGGTLTDPRITCTTPAGFVLTGDSLLAPTSEIRGRLRCSATTLPASVSASLTSAAGAQRADAALPSDSLTITAAIDLRGYTWRVTYACTGGTMDWTPLNYTDSAGVFHFVRADSILITGLIDTIAYSGDAATFPNYGTVGQVRFREARTLYATDGRVDSDTSPVQTYMHITEQSVDTLFMGNTLTLQYRQPMVRVGTTGRRYEGTGWCVADGSAPIRPAVLEAVTP